MSRVNDDGFALAAFQLVNWSLEGYDVVRQFLDTLIRGNTRDRSQ